MIFLYLVVLHIYRSRRSILISLEEIRETRTILSILLSCIGIFSENNLISEMAQVVLSWLTHLATDSCCPSHEKRKISMMGNKYFCF